MAPRRSVRLKTQAQQRTNQATAAAPRKGSRHQGPARARASRKASASRATAAAARSPTPDDSDQGETGPSQLKAEAEASDPEYEDSGEESDHDFVDSEGDLAPLPPRPAPKRRGSRKHAPPTPPKKPRVLTLTEMMPVTSDMKLILGPSDCTTGPGDQAGGARPAPTRQPVKMPKRKKDGTKSRREQLEGDLTDQEDSDAIDPRDLPLEDLDYSRYTRLFRSHPHLRHAWSSLPEPGRPRMADQPPELKIKLLPFQREGVAWMVNQESTKFGGGILADEMGMGKTLQTIALMLANRGKPTLVVCPTVALMQWKAEIEAATSALSVFIYYGNDRKKLVDEHGRADMSELVKHDVVLTTYAVMETGMRRETQGYRRQGMLHHEKSMLHSINWFRIVMDEAHNLKDRHSNTSRAAYMLKSTVTWSLTGTPLHNRIGELYSLIRLTRADPFCMYFCHSCDCVSTKWNFSMGKHCSLCGCKYTYHFSYWNMHIQKPIQAHNIQSVESNVAFKKLSRLLDNVMLRRTKIERADDMGLPPRIVVTRRDKFNPEEEDLYMSLFSNYRREFDSYAEHGTILNNYANLFELITRMRLAANHPDLLRLKIDAKDKLGTNSNDTLVCSLCTEEAEDPILARCKHVFCRIDAQEYVQSAEPTVNLRCPVCYALFEIDLEQEAMAHPKAPTTIGAATSMMDMMLSTPATTEYKRSIVNRIDMKSWRSSTKIEALVEELSRHRQSNANIKSIVFSQFVNFLDMIQWRLNRAGFSVCRLDGRMTPAQRDAVIRTFMTQPEFTVFLVSLKAGGVALNLTEASNVYLADCWWNPSVEIQAMDRIHRMGQYRPVKITRIVIDNSIESRIISLQVKKQLLVDSTIGRDKKSLDRLSEQDLDFLFSS
ncbi:DNA repair protein rad16 [Coemansia sp. RSA 552]|nr:DNA repair protein rad16 [Coemansia sp. RSA 552]